MEKEPTKERNISPKLQRIIERLRREGIPVRVVPLENPIAIINPYPSLVRQLREKQAEKKEEETP